ncbi:hypothetical protein Tco_1318886 [Tanacetum coccineum]
MFAFCRFIKVLDSDTLINSISNIWIGKLRLHANVARYARKEESKLSHTVVKVAKSNRDFLSLLRTVMTLISVKLRPMLMLSKLLTMESLRMLSYAIRNKDAESTVGLANDIGYENIYINNDQVHDECAHKVLVTTHKYGSKGTDEEPLDNDPFELDSLIKKRGGKDTKVKCSVTPDFPPGFSLDSHENKRVLFHATNKRMMFLENILDSLWLNVWRKQSRNVCNENYVVVEGLWFPNDVRLMWIRSVCPLILAKSIFNERHAEIFNEFLSNYALIDIPLGGFSFTWTDKCYLGERILTSL